jgi:heat shock protein HslJ
MKTETGSIRPDAIGIEGPEWHLVEVSGVPVSPLAGERRPFIRFDAAKKQATGFAGCNNFFGSYELEGSSLTFGPMGATRMFCEGESGEVEMRFMQALEQTRTGELRENTLILLKNGKVLARFARDRGNDSATVGELEITGTIWQWVQTLYNDDTKAAPADPKNYIVQFQEDGTINVKADCNQKGGTYFAEGKRLSLKITHSTMAACPEGSLEDEFVRGLSGGAIYFIKDGHLYIDLKYDSGTMKFSEQKEK